MSGFYTTDTSAIRHCCDVFQWRKKCRKTMDVVTNTTNTAANLSSTKLTTVSDLLQNLRTVQRPTTTHHQGTVTTALPLHTDPDPTMKWDRHLHISINIHRKEECRHPTTTHLHTVHPLITTDRPCVTRVLPHRTSTTDHQALPSCMAHLPLVLQWDLAGRLHPVDLPLQAMVVTLLAILVLRQVRLRTSLVRIGEERTREG